MKKLFFALLLLPISFSSKGYNPIWANIDKRLINGVIAANTNAASVEKFFIKGNPKYGAKNLGFGWSERNSAIGGGYISLHATFYYYHDTIRSYTVYPQLPDDKHLHKMYMDWYSKGFSTTGGTIIPYLFGEQNILKPIKQYNKYQTQISQQLLEYMSPTSGDTYGYYGGYANTILQNREAFNKIKNQLTPELAIALLYSINPISRLTGIEYYLKNKSLFNNQAEIEDWAESIYNEVPKVDTLNGCIGSLEDARLLVLMYSSK